MTVTSATSTTPASGGNSQTGLGLGSLGQADFLNLLTTELQQQDPTDPVDNKEMLAQMAQFSQLAGITDMSTTLSDISGKLDTLTAAATSSTNA